MTPGMGSSLPFNSGCFLIPCDWNNVSVELKSGAQRRARVPGVNPVSQCVGLSHPLGSKQQVEWDVQGGPILSPLYLAWGSAFIITPRRAASMPPGMEGSLQSHGRCLPVPSDWDQWSSGARKGQGGPEAAQCAWARGVAGTHLPLSQQRVGLLHWGAALGVEGLGGQYVTLFVEGGTLWRQTPQHLSGAADS